MMQTKLKVRNLVRQAELYRKQGLFLEALDHYTSAIDLISNADNIKNKNDLISVIRNKIDQLDAKVKAVEGDTPMINEQEVKVILHEFRDKPIEGAIALANFGAYPRAMSEFAKLIDNTEMRTAAAKNMIRCHEAQSSLVNGIKLYKKWVKDERFTNRQIEDVRVFLENLLKREGRDEALPQRETSGSASPIETEPPAPPPESGDKVNIDISTVLINFTKGSHAGQSLELDVSFQTDNIINLIIPKVQKSLVESISVGQRLDDVQYFSPMAIFSGSAIVKSKKQISSGPKQGDFTLDLEGYTD
jgi:hypothetical protein